MSIGRTVRELTDATQIITPRYLRWLGEHGDDPYPAWVTRRVAALLRRSPRERAGTFSASSAGTCLRAQEFTFLGKQQSIERGTDPRLVHIFNDGKWRHLRWQAALLSAEIIRDIEVPTRWPEMHSAGSLDGAGEVWWSQANLAFQDQRFGLEIKGVNTFQFKRYTSGRQPIEQHLRQVHRYFLTTGLDLFVVIYEDKGTSNWHEWVVRPDERLLDESRQELEELNRARRLRQLHEPLASCRIRKGKDWQNCPFAGTGGVCERTRRWT